MRTSRVKLFKALVYLPSDCVILNLSLKGKGGDGKQNEGGGVCCRSNFFVSVYYSNDVGHFGKKISLILRIPGSKLWRPDIELYNAIDTGPGMKKLTL